MAHTSTQHPSYVQSPFPNRQGMEEDGFYPVGWEQARARDNASSAFLTLSLTLTLLLLFAHQFQVALLWIGLLSLTLLGACLRALLVARWRDRQPYLPVSQTYDESYTDTLPISEQQLQQQQQQRRIEILTSLGLLYPGDAHRLLHAHQSPHTPQPPLQQQRIQIPSHMRLAMMNRDFSAEDYDMLLRLDSEPSQSRDPALSALMSQGLSPQLINRLPTFILKTTPTDTSDTSKEVCSVCLDDKLAGQELRIVPCLHSFHTACIDGWLQQKAQCPVCNFPVFQEEREREREQARHVFQQQQQLTAAQVTPLRVP